MKRWKELKHYFLRIDILIVFLVFLGLFGIIMIQETREDIYLGMDINELNKTQNIEYVNTKNGYTLYRAENGVLCGIGNELNELIFMVFTKPLDEYNTIISKHPNLEKKQDNNYTFLKLKKYNQGWIVEKQKSHTIIWYGMIGKWNHIAKQYGYIQFPT